MKFISSSDGEDAILSFNSFQQDREQNNDLTIRQIYQKVLY